MSSESLHLQAFYASKVYLVEAYHSSSIFRRFEDLTLEDEYCCMYVLEEGFQVWSQPLPCKMSTVSGSQMLVKKLLIQRQKEHVLKFYFKEEVLGNRYNADTHIILYA
jgi:hypothetical protein